MGQNSYYETSRRYALGEYRLERGMKSNRNFTELSQIVQKQITDTFPFCFQNDHSCMEQCFERRTIRETEINRLAKGVPINCLTQTLSCFSPIKLTNDIGNNTSSI